MMKSKLVAVTLGLCMLLCLLPGAALAQGELDNLINTTGLIDVSDGGNPSTQGLDGLRILAWQLAPGSRDLALTGDAAAWFFQENATLSNAVLCLDASGKLTIFSRSTNINLAGKSIAQLVVNRDAVIRTDGGTRIQSAQVNTPAVFAGNGRIDRMVANTSGVTLADTLAILPENILLAQGATLIIGNETFVGTGSTLPSEQPSPSSSDDGSSGSSTPTPDKTASLIFKWKEDGSAGGDQTGASSPDQEVAIGPIDNEVDKVVITLSNTTAQTLTTTNETQVTLTGNPGDANRTIEVNTASIKSDGGDITFTLTVAETDKQSITYNIKVTVAAPTTYDITVTTDGGGDNSTASASVTTAKAGDSVTLTANAASGYTFKEWEVVGDAITIENPTNNPATFTMPTSDVTVKAVFEQDQADPE